MEEPQYSQLKSYESTVACPGHSAGRPQSLPICISRMSTIQNVFSKEFNGGSLLTDAEKRVRHLCLLTGDQTSMSCSERAGGKGILADISHSLLDCCGYSGANGWNGRNGENTLSFSPRVALHSLTILKACL